jgi:hypothetical protein
MERSIVLFLYKLSLLTRFVHIVLAVLVLASSTGIVFNKHYCRGELRAQALFFTPESCHDTGRAPSKKPPCPLHADQTGSAGYKKDKCCDNRSAIVKSVLPQWFPQPDSLPVFAGLPALSRDFLPEYLLHFGFDLPRLPGSATGLPPPKCGLHIMFQVFRN